MSEIPLLNLTPICLQNTNNIINTLMFMCLDQGHDFRDEGGRTVVNGKKAWVNTEIDKQCYINKISRKEFQDNYGVNEGENVINSDKIFGQNEFIKGLLNTTFVGGDGAFGFIVIENYDYDNISSDDKDSLISNTVTNLLKDEISLQLFTTRDYYVLTSAGDIGQGGNGRTFEVDIGGKIINVLFLPFYKRAFNNGMHKLWSFNTKKHIYIININQLIIEKKSTPYLEYTIKSPVEFGCQKLTEIDLIVPQYYFNFSQFYEKKTNFLKFFKELTNTNFDSKNPDEAFKNMNEEQKEIVFNLFSKSLFSGLYLQDMDSEESFTFSNDNNELIKYTVDETSGIGYFHLKSDNYLHYCIPRGVKYWIEDCQNKAFKHFLQLLYKYQKPFIHPQYKINNDIDNRIDSSRKEIFDSLLENDNKGLKGYIAFKNRNEIFDEENDNLFMLKQYGVIPDTTIGNNEYDTTINKLINSLNNVEDGITCSEVVTREIESVTTDVPSYNLEDQLPMSDSATPIIGGGDLDFLKDETIEFEPKDERRIENIQENDSFTIVKRDIEKIYEKLNQTSRTDIIEKFIDYLKGKFGENDVNELISKPAIEHAKKAMPLEPVPLEPIISKPLEPVKIFDNRRNVNDIFNLTIPLENIKDEFVKINSTSSSVVFNNYIKEYSNSLQQYYDYIVQKSDTKSDSNYFNNCWQTLDFYEESQQKGGDAYYPYRFTVTSGQLDSSNQGGQSIPQYHPPEVDIYMPIFELNGKGKLKGIIARMVFAKQVYNNSINSKSQVIVFCHFVYVDFERTKISEPESPSEYPKKLQELLKYAIENTYYIKNEDSCINLEQLKQNTQINSPEEIDFILKFDDKENESSSLKRNWFKYYSYTQGPTVTDSIVVPTNGDNSSLSYIRKEASESSYVAAGIVNVAESLIKSSRKLKEIFGASQDLTANELDNHPGIVLFVKLFLIRNKYTGDKSRATDTLFLNQTKYVEGLQISNDENTLYNANMFGQNTIWSTTTKTIFNMAPYYSENKKMPISSGFYIKQLCNGLANNPNIQPEIEGFEGSSKKQETNEDARIKSEIKEDLLEKMNPEFIDSYASCIAAKLKKDKDIVLMTYIFGSRSIIDIVIEEIHKYSKFQEKFDYFSNFYNNFDDELDKIMRIVDDNISKNINPNTQNVDEKKAWDPIGEFIFISNPQKDCIVRTTNDAFIELNSINSEAFTSKLFSFISELKTCKIGLDYLYDFIFYLSKKCPWWMKLNVEYYKTILLNKYCYMCSSLICKFNDKISTITNDDYKKKLITYLNSRYTNEMTFIKRAAFLTKEKETCLKNFTFKPSGILFNGKNLSETCPVIKPEETKPPLGVINAGDTMSPDEMQENSDKLTYVSLNFLDILKNAKPDLNLAAQKELLNDSLVIIKNINDKKLDENDFRYIKSRKEDLGIFMKQMAAVKITKTSPVGGAVNVEQNKLQIIKPESKEPLKTVEIGLKKKTQESRIISEAELISFYNDSYKCNIGNYLKKFIQIIKVVEERFRDFTINLDDNVKTVFIKILLHYLNITNLSFTPNVDSKKITDVLNKIDLSYTTDQMNTIINLYSNQFNLYSLIYTLLNTNYSGEKKQLLVDLINENTDDYIYKELELPFTKLELLIRAMNFEDESSENELYQNKMDVIKPVEIIPQRTFVPTSGGSLKHKRKNIIKTRKMKKIHKKGTIKKRHMKYKKNTRRR